jgi:uncharacterized coiled-coil protein SlyX
MQTFAALKGKSEDELIKYYDDLGRMKSASQDIVLFELHQRMVNAQNARMESMTRQMRNMTIVILAFTVINVAAFVYQVFCTGL